MISRPGQDQRRTADRAVTRDEGFVPVVRADVSGGWQDPGGSWADYGIRLYVGSPDKIMGREAPPAPVPSGDHPWAGQVQATRLMTAEELERVLRRFPGETSSSS